MSIIEYNVPAAGARHEAAMKMPSAERPLHRLAAVRRQQNISRRTIARRTNADVSTVKQQEQETTDLLLSQLYQWQEILEVPVAELLVEADEPLSTPVMKRAQLLRLMKTATAILHRSQQVAIRRMAQMMVDQLVEIMPEPSEVTPWHAIGKRRTQDEVGQAASRRVSRDVFQDLGE